MKRVFTHSEDAIRESRGFAKRMKQNVYVKKTSREFILLTLSEVIDFVADTFIHVEEYNKFGQESIILARFFKKYGIDYLDMSLQADFIRVRGKDGRVFRLRLEAIPEDSVSIAEKEEMRGKLIIVEEDKHEL